MAQKYWDLFVRVKVSEYYYQFYSVNSDRWRTFIQAMCLIASACLSFSISWAVNESLALLWSLFILFAQIISTLQPIFPFEDRVHAAENIQKEFSELALLMEQRWIFFHTETSEQVIRQYFLDYQQIADKIESRYAPQKTFPIKPRLHQRAQKYAEDFFRRF